MMQPKLLQKLFYLFVFITMGGALGYAGGIGCETAGPVPPPTPLPTPTSTAIPTPPATPTPTPPVDLVTGDTSSDEAYIYYDVLNLIPGATAAPDVILNTTDVVNPGAVAIATGDDVLAVANTNDTGNSILLYGGFSGLVASPTPTPDVTLTSALDDIRDIAAAPGLASDDLYVSNDDDNTVTIYRDLGGIVAGGVDVPPDVILDNVTSNIGDPRGLTVVNNILYVCDGGNDEVLIFNGADSLTAAPTPSPDVILDGSSGIDFCARVRVFNNTLFVITEPSVGLNTPVVRVFSPADGLTVGQAPDFTLNAGILGALSNVFEASDAFMDDSTLLISKDPSAPTGFGMVGFLPPFFTNMPNDIFLNDPIENCPRLGGAQGSVFAACDPTSDPGVYGYLDADGIISGQDPDLILSDPAMSDPTGLDVQERATP